MEVNEVELEVADDVERARPPCAAARPDVVLDLAEVPHAGLRSRAVQSKCD